jgi:acetyltransferase-like isoleucine patch superfamily enzyme
MTEQRADGAVPHLAKRIAALLIAHVPTSALRILLYRLVPGYRIAPGCTFGRGVVIAVNAFTAGPGVHIRRGTCFIGPIDVVLAERTFIGRFNRIECGNGAVGASVRHMGYTRRFETGFDSLINEGHLFDVLGTIRIGRGSWVAGFDSQFLTHGAGVMDRNISIGDDCFVGSAVRFAPGCGVADRVIVAMGAVVTKQFPECNVIVGGLPARVLRARDSGDVHHFEKSW